MALAPRQRLQGLSLTESINQFINHDGFDCWRWWLRDRRMGVRSREGGGKGSAVSGYAERLSAALGDRDREGPFRAVGGRFPARTPAIHQHGTHHSTFFASVLREV